MGQQVDSGPLCPGCALNQVGFDDSDGGVAFSDNQVIVEFKFRMAMPALFKEVVERFTLTPKRISKYRLAVVPGLVEPPENSEAPPETDKPLCQNS
jgi:hypothetical protein